MADADLDDFFAKKDKNKKKVAKFTTNDILAKQSEKPKKIKKKKEAKEKSSQPDSTTTTATKNAKKETEEDEWHDYEDEVEKDFSDLKIQNLGNKEDDDDGNRPGVGTGSDDEGGRERREAASGPWKKANAKARASEATEAPAQPEPKKEPPKEEPSRPTGKYVPPGVRKAMESGMSGGSLSSSHGYGRRKRQAPNVMSEEDFPTLGGAAESTGDGPSPMMINTQFEQVRGGGRQMDDPHGQSQKLEIGNKFDALAGAES